MTLLDRTDDSLDDFSALAKAVPYAKQVVDAYKWARLKRFTAFLKGLDGSTSELPEKDRLKFEDSDWEHSLFTADFKRRTSASNRSR